MPLRLRPAGLLEGAPAAAAIEQGRALPLAGGPLAFAKVEALARGRDGGVASASGTVADLLRWPAEQWPSIGERVALALAAIVALRRHWAGLALDRPCLMGVLVVAGDGPSAGADAVERGRALLAAGADIVDIRLGGAPVSPEEEVRRAEPVVRALAQAGALVSVEAHHAAVLDAMLAAGPRIVSGLPAAGGERARLALAAENGVAVVLTHRAAPPRPPMPRPAAIPCSTFSTRSRPALPRARRRPCRASGSWSILASASARLTLLHATGCALGASHRPFMTRPSRGEAPGKRLGARAPQRCGRRARGAGAGSTMSRRRARRSPSARRSCAARR